jgi:hypothetical protein
MEASSPNMPSTEPNIIGSEHAYQLLGVPTSASAQTIKQAYRRMIKRWHPDLYATGTSAYVEATQMSRSINEAYALIQHAPLRYWDSIPADRSYVPQSPQAERAATFRTMGMMAAQFHRPDRLEFWVRFVCGAFFGGFISLRLVIYMEKPMSAVLTILGVALFCAFGAAKGGDKFWHSILRIRWYWWQP